MSSETEAHGIVPGTQKGLCELTLLLTVQHSGNDRVFSHLVEHLQQPWGQITPSSLFWKCSKITGLQSGGMESSPRPL